MTSINFLYRKVDNEMLLISGDAGGEVIVSELNYSVYSQDIQEVKVLFRKRAHKGQVVSIELYKHEDVFVSAGQDGVIA